MTCQTLEATKHTTSRIRDVGRAALGIMLVCAGASHLTFAREPFKAQVPPWVPLDPETVVLQSGVVEIALGTALLSFPSRKVLLGRVAGLFFACIFPGNLAQYKYRRNAFGLNTDGKRFARLFAQPVLIAWALWSTGAACRLRPGASELSKASPAARTIPAGR